MSSVIYKHRLLAGACVVAMASASHAATITWDAAATNVDYAVTTQVSAANTFVDSFTFRATDTTVNGVTFKRYTGSAASVASFAGSNTTVDLGTGGDQYPGGSNPDNRSTYNAYATMLGYAGQVANPVGAYVKFSGLTSGTAYQIQLWNAAWDNSYPTIYSSSADFTTGVSPQVKSIGSVFTDSSIDPVKDKFVPQFINGSFVADETSQTIYFKQGANWTMPSSGQIRAVVPEPASLALLGLSALSLLTRRRRA